MATEPKEILSQALEYAGKGLYVLVLHGIANGACTCGDASCKSAGKHPATGNGLKDATTDATIITAWFSGSAPRNIGILTGKESGIFVIDIDGSEAEKKLLAYLGQLPDTLKTVTGRGQHLFFKHPGQPVKSFTGVLGKDSKIDCRGEGGYVVAAGSMHVSGKRYEAVPRPIAEAPGALLALVYKVDKAADRHHSHSVKGGKQSMSDDEVRDMLSYLDPNMGYDDWLKIGMGLHSGGYCVDLWDEWSRGSDKYKPGDCLYKWGTFNVGEQPC